MAPTIELILMERRSYLIPWTVFKDIIEINDVCICQCKTLFLILFLFKNCEISIFSGDLSLPAPTYADNGIFAPHENNVSRCCVIELKHHLKCMSL